MYVYVFSVCTLCILYGRDLGTRSRSIHCFYFYLEFINRSLKVNQGRDENGLK